MSDDIDDQPARYADTDRIRGRERRELLWQGRMGQIVGLWTYLFMLIATAVLWYLLPPEMASYGTVGIAVVAGVEWAKIYFTRFELNTTHLIKRWGIVTTYKDPIPLYRIEDSGITSPLIMRPFGRGNVRVISSDRTDPLMTMFAVREPEDVEESLREAYEDARARRGTRVIE